ncbi:lytic transglycosylase [Robbsia andropogonis]|uniref:Lytic transglycosylase n=1 Tax=Robbsia andropogonis TaxID=28092 RepID=A0A0F5K4W7_9BURK|nr:lytic transglycosylase domain-containing protein [Robbsia andropogonis]KKB64567.1 lytic transglycosylase [Robbsia andropogonis]MCP1117713.1 lytic transglycosylase domain-containing protein [Robbsia andropogonis]MCP1127179.1 lytic transglycosylase domain-containing protein [Robbsia andropogonis]
MAEIMVRVYRAMAAGLVAVVLAACSSPGAVRAQSATMTPDVADRIFLQLRDAARRNDAAAAAQLSAQIPDYPVPSYVAYYRIKPQMFDQSGKARLDAPDDQILAFLQQYDGTAIADRLRNDYLTVLGARHDWRTFMAQYPRFALDDDTQVKCYALEARASRNENVADAARQLLTNPRWYGDGCVDLIMALASSGQFTSDDVWAQMRLAYEGNYTSLGRRIADALGPVKPSDQTLSMATDKPPIYLAQPIRINDPAHQLALLAIIRMAANDPAQAAVAYANVEPRLTAIERGIGWGAIAYRAALKQMPAAVDWYRLTANAPLTLGEYEWRTRAALSVQDWTMVRWSIEQMPPVLRDQPVWVYWRARAMQQGGDAASAQTLYQSISNQYNFYGQLATEALGGLITVPPRTVVSAQEIADAGKNPGFALARRFYDLNMRFEGNREWNWQLRGMTDRQLLAAANYANSIQLFDRAVNTADRTRVEHDFTLRYLAPFRPIVDRYAASTGLDVEWAYGLMRQESRFIYDARSGVGASGLMQLMPGTADLVARKLGMGKLTRAQVNELDTNIKLGTNYLSMVYNQFDQSPVLASAGYNAGPGRSRQWRAALTRPEEGAIFAETIPFNETRDYVENVLSNTVYYGALFENRPKSLRERLGIIAP